MTLHYHGTPITPISALLKLSGRCFCVSFAAPQDVERCHTIGQSVMLDNGAFTIWKRNHAPKTDWRDFYEWVDPWLDYPTTWAVVPDVIEGGEEIQDKLLKEFPFGDKGAPVWHMDESIERLLRLCDEWSKVCIGSCGEYEIHPMTDKWMRRMDLVWDEISKRHKRTPWIHMLRGMKMCKEQYPFASVDSTDVAKSHAKRHKCPGKMAETWDGYNTPGRWTQKPKVSQLEFWQ